MTGLGTRVYLLKVNDYNEPQTVADVFERIAKYSGVFDVQVSSAYVTSITSAGVSSVGMDWVTAYLTDIYFQNGVVVDADVIAANPFAVSALPAMGTSNQYVVTRGTDNRFAVFRKTVAGETMIYRTADAYSAAGHIKISARIIQFDGTETEENTWVAISLWFNGDLLFTAYDELRWTYFYDSNYMVVGYGRYRNTTAYLNNFTVSQLHPFVDSLTVDPGESALQGLQRAISGYDVDYWMRPTGALKATRPSVRPVAMSIQYSQLYAPMRRSFDYRVPVAFRFTAGYSEINTDKVVPLDYYQIIHNSFFSQRYEALVERDYVDKRLQSQREKISIVMPANVLLEVDDRININGVSWIIESIGYEIRSTDIRQTIQAKKYTYG